MDLALANHSSYPRIGDDSDGQMLRRTLAQWEKGKKTAADLRAAEDRMTERALQEQIDAGLDLVTDGQIRWYDPISHLAGKLEGVRINGLLRFFDTNFYFRQPVVAAPPQRKQALVVEDFQFATGKSSRAVKAVLTGPLTLARLSLSGNGAAGDGLGFEKLLDGYTQALAEELAALVAAGAAFVQIDEPALLKHPADFPLLERSLGALAARKGSAELALAVYFGDPAPVYENLQKLPVDVLVLDFTYSAGLVEAIATNGSEKTLALGLVDGRNTRVEDEASVARQLDKLSRRLSSERAWLTSSCGLEHLPRDRAKQKLAKLAQIKQTFLGTRA